MCTIWQHVSYALINKTKLSVTVVLLQRSRPIIIKMHALHKQCHHPYLRATVTKHKLLHK